MKKLFLHGLRVLRKRNQGLVFQGKFFLTWTFPDYSGSLDHRLSQLSEICGQ